MSIRTVLSTFVLLIVSTSWPTTTAAAAPPTKAASAPVHMLEVDIIDTPKGSTKPSKATLVVALGGDLQGYVSSGGEVRRCEVSSRSATGATSAPTRLNLECVPTSGRAPTPTGLRVAVERSFRKGERVVVARLAGADGHTIEVAVTGR